MENVNEQEKEFVCNIMLGDEHQATSADFVTVLAQEDGNAAIYYNTDALTMGIAIKLLTGEYVKMIQQLPEKERFEVLEILGSAFDPDKIASTEEDNEETEE